MDIVYDWDIVKVEFVLKEGELYYVIKTIKFQYTGIDQVSNQSYTVPGEIDLLKADPNNYLPRGQVTKNDYISWIKQSGISENYLRKIICHEIMLKNQK